MAIVFRISCDEREIVPTLSPAYASFQTATLEESPFFRCDVALRCGGLPSLASKHRVFTAGRVWSLYRDNGNQFFARLPPADALRVLDWMHGENGRLIYDCEPYALVGGGLCK